MMTAIRPLRGALLATLLLFTSGCIIVHSSHTQSGRPAPAAAPRPAKPKPKQPAAKPAKKPAPKPAGKPARPKPAGKPAAKPRPAPTPRPAPPSVPKHTQIVVPVRVAFAEAVAKIDAQIVKTMKQDWQTVTAPGSATKVEVKYRVWRDPIKASFAGGKLKVAVDVYYAADVRASAKNPLGGGRIWITKGETWGTQAAPQRLTAKFEARLGIEDDFRVSADSRLVDLDHGPAPSGNVCVKAVAKLCISKQAIAPQVRKNLESQLVPQIQKALKDADKQVEKSLNLKPQAQQLWRALQQPQPLQKLGQAYCPGQLGAVCDTPAWLVAQPESVGVSQPRMDGKDLRVDLAVGGRLAVELGDRPTVTPTPLPKLKPVTEPPGFAVRAQLQVPIDSLGAELGRRLYNKQIGGGGAPQLVITRASLVDKFDPRNPRRIRLALTLGGALDAVVTVQGELDYDAKTRELALRDVDYTLDTDNEALKQLSAANHAALRQLVADKARWKLDARAAGLVKAVSAALGGIWRGHLKLDGELSQVHLERFSVKQGVLSADVVLAGVLAVAYTP